MSVRNVLFKCSNIRALGPLTPIRGVGLNYVIKSTCNNGHTLLARTCSTGFSIKEILPAQDAFAQRHIGPRKSERDEMLNFLELEVSVLKFTRCC